MQQPVRQYMPIGHAIVGLQACRPSGQVDGGGASGGGVTASGGGEPSGGTPASGGGG